MADDAKFQCSISQEQRQERTLKEVNAIINVGTRHLGIC